MVARTAYLEQEGTGTQDNEFVGSEGTLGQKFVHRTVGMQKEGLEEQSYEQNQSQNQSYEQNHDQNMRQNYEQQQEVNRQVEESNSVQHDAQDLSVQSQNGKGFSNLSNIVDLNENKSTGNFEQETLVDRIRLNESKSSDPGIVGQYSHPEVGQNEYQQHMEGNMQPGQPQMNLQAKYDQSQQIIQQMNEQMHKLIQENQNMKNIIQGMSSQSQQSEMALNEMKIRIQNETSANQHKIAYLLREKQDADERIQNYEMTISKYARMVEQLQMEGKINQEKLQNNAPNRQQKMIEDELRVNMEKMQFKLR